MLIWSFTYFNMDYLEEEEEELLFYLLVDIISKSLLVCLLIIYLILVNFRFEGFFFINVDVRVNLYVPQLIQRVMKLTIM